MELNYNVEKTEIDGITHGPKAIVREFLRSGKDIAEVAGFCTKKVVYARRGIEQYADRHCLPVRAMTRGGRLFVLREAENDE